MKTLCVVVVVVLSLTSVCQAAPLACTKLLEPVAEGPNLSGTWYIIAVSMPTCWTSAAVGAIFQGVAVDVTPQDTPNLYNMNLKMKIGPQCFIESEEFVYTNNTIFDVDSNNMATGPPEVLLQTGCPDCLVLKDSEDDEILLLLSRRKRVTSDELMEFGKQSQCLGWSDPYILQPVDEYGQCKSMDDMDEDDVPALGQIFYQVLLNMKGELIKCFIEALPSMW